MLVDDISTPQLNVDSMNVGEDLVYLSPELWLLRVLHKHRTLLGFASILSVLIPQSLSALAVPTHAHFSQSSSQGLASYC